jgi:hypothetical protein
VLNIADLCTTMPFVQLSSSHQNVRLFYELHGHGETKIIFIMGLLTDGAAWIRQVDIRREDLSCHSVRITSLNFSLNNRTIK